MMVRLFALAVLVSLAAACTRAEAPTVAARVGTSSGPTRSASLARRRRVIVSGQP